MVNKIGTAITNILTDIKTIIAQSKDKAIRAVDHQADFNVLAYR